MSEAYEKLSRALQLASLELEALQSEDIDSVEILCAERAILQEEALAMLHDNQEIGTKDFELVLLELQGKLLIMEQTAKEIQNKIKERLHCSKPQMQAMRGYNKASKLLH